MRAAGAEITAPAARFFNSIRRTGNDMGGNLSAYFDAASKNAALTKEVKANRTKLIEARALKVENARLRGLLKLRDESGEQVAVGRLISSTASSTRRVATLSIGSNYGIERRATGSRPIGSHWTCH